MSCVDEASTNSTSLSLLGRVRLHDSAAWQRFATIYTPLVYGWARRSGLQSADAADVVQEAFRTVAGKLGDFGRGQQEPSFRGWLYAIVRNLVRLHYRRGQLAPRPMGGDESLRQLAAIHDAVPTDDDGSAVEDRRYLLHRTLKAIERDFEPPTWQAFWRMVVEGESAAEIGPALGMTATAVRQAKFRVLCRLRSEIDGF
jgi:RNA polymerase sigma-70 factor (ECF subfamily)